MVETIVLKVFASNTLEDAGPSYAESVRLCKLILAGKDVFEEPQEGSVEYGFLKQHLAEKKRTVNPQGSAAMSPTSCPARLCVKISGYPFRHK